MRFCLGTRVRAVIDPAEPLAVDWAVDLRRREGAVPEQLLDRPQVGAAFEEVRGERVPEPVRMPHEAAQRARVETPPAHGEEERILRATCELRSRVPQIERDAVRGFFAERDDPLLASLAADVHGLLLEVDVREVQADGLRTAQASGVDELDERAIPGRDRAVAVQVLDDGLDLTR